MDLLLTGNKYKVMGCVSFLSLFSNSGGNEQEEVELIPNTEQLLHSFHFLVQCLSPDFAQDLLKQMQSCKPVSRKHYSHLSLISQSCLLEHSFHPCFFLSVCFAFNRRMKKKNGEGRIRKLSGIKLFILSSGNCVNKVHPEQHRLSIKKDGNLISESYVIMRRQQESSLK